MRVSVKVKTSMPKVKKAPTSPYLKPANPVAQAYKDQSRQPPKSKVSKVK